MINIVKDDNFNQLQHRQHSELVFVQNNPLYDGNDDLDQQNMQEKLNLSTPKSIFNEDEAIYEPTVQAFSFEFNEGNLSTVQQYVVNQPSKIMKQPVQTNLSKPIIIPWEEIRYNRQRKGLGYEKYVTFHIPDTPNQFSL